MADAVGVFQALVLDEPGSRLPYSMQRGVGSRAWRTRPGRRSEPRTTLERHDVDAPTLIGRGVTAERPSWKRSAWQAWPTRWTCAKRGRQRTVYTGGASRRN